VSDSVLRLLLADAGGRAGDARAYEAALSALHEAHEVALACADACLAAPDVARLRRVIALCLDCADVCATTAAVLTRTAAAEPRIWQRLLETCIQVCRACADACARHARVHEACAVCVQACRRAEAACDRVLGLIPV
jgi:uncharacterized membrane protein